MKLFEVVKSKDGIITMLLCLCICLALCLLFALADIKVTNAICIEEAEEAATNRVDEIIDDKLDEKLKQFLLDNYHFRVVEQDGHGINIYQSGDGTVSIPKEGE